jgi:hypothetical protein
MQMCFTDSASAVDPGQSRDEVLEAKGTPQVVVLNHLPGVQKPELVLQLDGDCCHDVDPLGSTL